MSLRAVVAAWLVALLALAIPIALQVQADLAQPRFHGRPIAVIGTSLMRQAVPDATDGPPGLLADGRTYWRIGMSAASEDMIVTQLSRAVDERVSTVFVEANPLLFDIASTPIGNRCDSPGAAFRTGLARWRRVITDAFAHLVGRRGELDTNLQSDDLERLLAAAKPVARRHIYPLSLRGPCDPSRLHAVAARAAAAGIQLVLVLPPRSDTSNQLLGAGPQAALTALAQDLARSLGAGLFSVGPWPDSEFIDGEHLNRHGQARFLDALRRWWRQRP